MLTNSPQIIAEIGFNHEGNMDLAEQMVRAAARAGADAVKIQTFQAGDLVLPNSPHYEGLKAGEMDLEQHRRLSAAAAEEGVEFLSTPFSRRAVDLLEKVGVKRYKIASMDLTNLDLLAYVAQTRKPVIVSTGMATLAEIAASLDFLNERQAGEVCLLHCISDYPSQAGELNLAVIPFLKQCFGLPVGYSDHFPGVKACLAAAMLGADLIETHFTLDRSKPGADHEHSADAQQLKELVEDIQLFRQMAGGHDFLQHRSDRVYASAYRRGLYTAADLDAGAVLERQNIISCRPENGLGPGHLQALLGRKLQKSVKAFEPLHWEDL
ncbi:MAG: N-acetylneuraminate synthase family protein [Pseudomonadota bacterium]